MPLPQSYDGQVPLGKMTIAAAGTPTSLAVNCGNFGGSISGPGYQNPGLPGGAAVQFTIQSDPSNSGNLYLMPRGKTVTANPGSIMAIIFPGGSITYPNLSTGPGMQPENYALDTDGAGAQVAYGFATMQG